MNAQERRDGVDSREISIGCAHTDIENKIEWLIKGRVVSASLPGISWCRAVDRIFGKVTIRPQILVLLEVKEENLLK